MNRTKTLPMLIVLCIAFINTALLVQNGWAQGASLPLEHPEQEEGEDLRRCSSCHETERNEFPFKRFEHTPLFGDNHRLTALGNPRVCQICHQERFCSDCHGAGVGMKPSIKHHGETRRLMPHRGDYLTRHRIDGRLNPGKCFRCHGRPKAAAACRSCHG